MALIVTEAVNNAIEHGLPHRGGSIHVGLDISDGTITLDITDDGKGLPANFDPGFGQSLGLRISNALAGQLNGRFSLMPAAKGGATARLDLPVDRKSVVSGKRASVREALGGRRLIKKKK